MVHRRAAQEASELRNFMLSECGMRDNCVLFGEDGDVDAEEDGIVQPLTWRVVLIYTAQRYHQILSREQGSMHVPG